MIRIGIVGCGRILAAHLRGYRLLREAGIDDFRITALCSRKEADARMYVRRGEGPPQRPAVSNLPGDPLAVGDEYLSDFQDDVDVAVYTDFRQMIAEGPIDAVNDFTSHGVHHQVAAAAFDHGKDVLSQKPLAITMRAARQMCDRAEASGRMLGVFENARYRPVTRRTKWALDTGLLGRLQMVLFGNVGTWWSPNRIVAETPWRHRRIEAGGIALDMGVHQFDLIRHYAGEIKHVTAQTAVVEPQRVTLDAAGRVVQQIDCDADDAFFATFETQAGAHGTLFASWAGHGEPTVLGPGPVLYGTAGRVVGNDLTLDGQPRTDLASAYDLEATDERRQRDFPRALEDQLALCQFDWLDSIRRRQPMETDAGEGLRDLACAFALVESAHAGRTVEVEEVLSGELRDYQRPIDEHFGIV